MEEYLYFQHETMHLYKAKFMILLSDIGQCRGRSKNDIWWQSMTAILNNLIHWTLLLKVVTGVTPG